MPPRKPVLDQASLPVAVKLSALWASTMFMYVYVDIFSFYKPGVVRDILRGKVSEFDITQVWALGALALMTIPALMVFLSVGLRPAASRWANIVVAGLYLVVSLGNLAGESWTYLYFGAAIEVALLVTIIRYAWTWPRRPTRPTIWSSVDSATGVRATPWPAARPTESLSTMTPQRV